MTEFIQTTFMPKKGLKIPSKLYQGLPLGCKAKYIGRGGSLPQGSIDFEKLWTDNTFTVK